MKKIKTRDRIKIAAQALFAERVIEAVTVREIVAAADQKNMASLHYYFRTKQDLARELLTDAGEKMESHRTELLDKLEAKGGPDNILEVLRIFIECAIVPGDDPRNLSNIRLFVLALRENPKFVLEVLGDPKEAAYYRCLNHIRTFMKHMEPDLVETRLHLMQIYAFSALSERERALTNENFPNKIWHKDNAVEQVVQSAMGMLLA